ncbi:MAG: GTPase [Candidatus Diapherotrites archaeon]|nr:50S ribosome-binding GTPase [Candidatus Micrarchaeota archaeon]MBU1939130.1 50S ribosome-binding GTPase [Candidatus Micrarchaeota archaeon]
MPDREFDKRVMKVIRKSDILLEVLDARFPAETRNFRLEKKIKWMEKGLIIVLNKADMVSQGHIKKTSIRLQKKGHVVVEVSCNDRKGKQKLKAAINMATRNFGRKTRHRVTQRGMIVGLFGYPNTGKSSLINYLGGKKKARTSAQAAFTRGEQFIRVNEDIMLIDTPGVISFKGKPWQDLVILNALSPNQLYDRIAAAERLVKFLMENNPKALEKAYDVKIGKETTDEYEILEQIAIARKRLTKGGGADLEAIARIIITDWQRGKIKI